MFSRLWRNGSVAPALGPASHPAISWNSTTREFLSANIELAIGIHEDCSKLATVLRLAKRVWLR
jgi:hypothetical protein